jgi:hypothetical protein
VAQIDNQPQWRRSSRCDGGQCVEVAFTGALVAMRDGKNPADPHLSMEPHSWMAFVGAVRTGEFDRVG